MENGLLFFLLLPYFWMLVGKQQIFYFSSWKSASTQAIEMITLRFAIASFQFNSVTMSVQLILSFHTANIE